MSISSPDVVAVDVRCVGCGYNVRGLPRSVGRCPECGTDVEASARWRDLGWDDRPSAVRFLHGLRLIQLNSLLVVIVLGGGCLLSQGVAAGPHVLALAGLLLAIVLNAGWWLATAVRGLVARHSRLSRPVTRAAHAAWAGLLLAALVGVAEVWFVCLLAPAGACTGAWYLSDVARVVRVSVDSAEHAMNCLLIASLLAIVAGLIGWITPGWTAKGCMLGPTVIMVGLALTPLHVSLVQLADDARQKLELTGERTTKESPDAPDRPNVTS